MLMDDYDRLSSLQFSPTSPVGYIFGSLLVVFSSLFFAQQVCPAPKMGNVILNIVMRIFYDFSLLLEKVSTVVITFFLKKLVTEMCFVLGGRFPMTYWSGRSASMQQRTNRLAFGGAWLWVFGGSGRSPIFLYYSFQLFLLPKACPFALWSTEGPAWHDDMPVDGTTDVICRTIDRYFDGQNRKRDIEPHNETGWYHRWHLSFHLIFKTFVILLFHIRF